MDIILIIIAPLFIVSGIIGILSPIPRGIIIVPFIGALIGELLNKSDSKIATRAAFSSFIGFLTTTFINL
tara:strand:- start:2893 stop:3102 length:210 start_codon:yes stop_codon:yes gene_type:complete